MKETKKKAMTARARSSAGKASNAIFGGVYPAVKHVPLVSPRIQILSAQDLIDAKPVRMPQGARAATFAQAQKERKREGVQGRLE